MTESLNDKLKSLGVSLGGTPKLEKPAANSFLIENVVSGSDLNTIYGKTFQTHQVYPEDYLHGDILLCATSNLDTLTRWAKIPAHSPTLEASDFIFLDAETSGLAGGTGTYSFMVGLGFFTANNFQVIQLFMRDPGQEAALLAALTHYVSNYKGVVTFNGKSFDIPLLNGRHVLNGLTSPFKEMFHIDLLPLARRIWRNRLDDRSLKNLETQILGLTRTQEEVPGWMVPELYFDYLKTQDARPLAGVFYHNLNDIVSLAALFKYTSRLLLYPLENPNTNSLDLIGIARLYEELGLLDVAIQVYEQSLLQGLPEDFFVQTVMRYADIYRKRNDWPAVLTLWERAADYKCIEACIELSKYFEHHEKNYPTALNWVERGLEKLFSFQITLSKQKYWQDELARRHHRIIEKIKKGGENHDN